MSRIGLFVGVGAEDQDSRRVKLSCLEHEAIEEGSNRVYVGGLRLIKPGGIMSPTPCLHLHTFHCSCTEHSTQNRFKHSFSQRDRCKHTVRWVQP